MILPLEDQYGDIISKAVAGLSMDSERLSTLSGLAPENIRAARRGHYDPSEAEALANALGLNTMALKAIGEKRYQPHPCSLPGLVAITSDFPPDQPIMQVNAYLLRVPDQGAAILFDTGCDLPALLGALGGDKLTAIFLTHTHRDHIAVLADLLDVTGKPPVHVSRQEALPGCLGFEVGETFDTGPLRIETRRSSGHSPGGTTYVVHGLPLPLAVVGDALFAGSMGGAPHNWQEALDTLHESVFSLPDATLLCPGHGPLTTVGEQKKYNPFYSQP